MKVRLFAFAAIVATGVMSANAQGNTYNFDNTWWNGMSTLNWDYSGDPGPAAALFNVNFMELNSTSQTWSDFHFDLHNYNGNVTFVGPQDGGKAPASSWTQGISGDGTPTASISFYDPGGLPIAPGESFYANLTFLVDLDANGGGHFDVTWYPSVVPEPSALAGIGIAALGMVGLRRRRR